MRLVRLPYEPAAVADFYEEALGALGALCERSWHDRLEVAADGRAAALWPGAGPLHLADLRFAPSGETAARDPGRDVFPGCPLTFRVAEALRPSPVALERVLIRAATPPRPPDPAVAEKLWRSRHPDTMRWHLDSPFVPDRYFSLVALARFEIQAIDQHWSLHRVALGLPDGDRDEGLANEIGFAVPEVELPEALAWPALDPARCSELLRAAIEPELSEELARVRERQQRGLERELGRIDAYFETYARDLQARTERSASADAKARLAERLAAAKAEQARHRADQAARHEILVRPHIDALLLVAEPAWRARLQIGRAHAHLESLEAVFIPRARRWSRIAPRP